MTHEVTNAGINKDQLSSMTGQARGALNANTIEVLADKSYFAATLPHGNHDNLLTLRRTTPELCAEVGGGVKG